MTADAGVVLKIAAAVKQPMITSVNLGRRGLLPTCVATSCNFNNLSLRGKARFSAQRGNFPMQGLRCRFGHGAAGFADQEDDRLKMGVAMTAGEKSVPRGEPVNQAILQQKIERAVNRDRRGMFPGRGGDPFDQIIGAERPPFLRQDFEHAPAPRRQLRALATAELFGMCESAAEGGGHGFSGP